LDYGKYLYERKKIEQKHKKAQKPAETKEIRISTKISKHDLEIKINKVKRFFEKGNRVRLVIVFRGREIAFLDRGKELLNQVCELLKDLATPEEKPLFQNRRLSVILTPNKK